MLKIARNENTAITTEIVCKTASSGDLLAKEILKEAADYLAIWLGGIIDLLEPEVIILGGGLGRVMISFRGEIRRKLTKWTSNPHWQKVRIVGAQYGPESALVGAAAQWFPTRES